MSFPGEIDPVANSLIAALRAHDPLTAAHCKRVAAESKALAGAAGLSKLDQTTAYYSGLFHDIGKIGISPEILNKPGPLNAEEAKKLRIHPALGEHIIRQLASFSYFEKFLPGIRLHHERWDGKGYPDRQAEEKIPLIARVIAIVDTVDAMTSSRPYRKGLPHERAWEELFLFSGTQFDPHLVNVYLERNATPALIEAFAQKAAAKAKDAA